MYNPPMTASLHTAATSEAKFLIKALENGWEIATPFYGGYAYDYVVRRGPTAAWETVQVKTAYPSRQLAQSPLEVGLRRSKGTGMMAYKDGDFDLLFVVFQDQCWLIPWVEVAGKTSCIQVGRAKYNKWKCSASG